MAGRLEKFKQLVLVNGVFDKQIPISLLPFICGKPNQYFSIATTCHNLPKYK